MKTYLRLVRLAALLLAVLTTGIYFGSDWLPIRPLWIAFFFLALGVIISIVTILEKKYTK